MHSETTASAGTDGQQPRSIGEFWGTAMVATFWRECTRAVVGDRRYRRPRYHPLAPGDGHC